MLSFVVCLAVISTVSAHPGNNKWRNQPQPAAPVATKSAPSVLEIAIGNPDFSTLVAAVKAADLVETLSGDGPFTIFAPNNDAFAKIPSDTLNDLLAKPEDLAAILTRHVLAANIPSSGVPQGETEVDTVGGEKLTVVRSGDDISVRTSAGEAKVIAADVVGTNGVIHVIDTVV